VTYSHLTELESKLKWDWHNADWENFQKEVEQPQGQLDSYRPIALTSCLAKVMERMVAKRLLAESCGMLNSDQSGFRPQWWTENQVIRLSQAISNGFQAKKPPDRMVLAFLDFLKAYNKVWWVDLLAMMLRESWSAMFGGSRGSCPIDRQGLASTGLTAGPRPCGKACPRGLS
jgi:hypothetical protein